MWRAAPPGCRRIEIVAWSGSLIVGYPTKSRRCLMDQNMTPANRMPMERVLYEVKKVIVGQDHLLERLVVALLARGHILVEGVPGVAKTMAIKTLADSIGGDFKRLQFTPDLVPGGLVGTRVSHTHTGR